MPTGNCCHVGQETVRKQGSSNPAKRTEHEPAILNPKQLKNGQTNPSPYPQPASRTEQDRFRESELKSERAIKEMMVLISARENRHHVDSGDKRNRQQPN